MTPLEKLERLKQAYEENDVAGDKVIDAFYRCITLAQERRFPDCCTFVNEAGSKRYYGLINRIYDLALDLMMHGD